MRKRPSEHRAWRRRAAALSLLAAAVGAAAQPAAERRNWFDDPFFQVTHAVAGCPVPAGPFITEAERRVQAHHRAERGTSCWLAGQCAQPNFYAYDAGIAQALRDKLAQHNPFVDSTLWVTVQGRVVYIEGCVRNAAQAGQLEAFVRTIPYVQQALASVYSDLRSRPPYSTLNAGSP